ncbi:hypothetical protein [Klebsiella pneumoniae IS53]|nr:hypothetical protein [Klebsiella pneumoniae IS53]VTN17773.1 Uncharacterised protein [Klebsiella pneumoniae]
MPLHILPRGLLDLLFVGGGLAGGRQQGLVVIAHLGADDHLELAGVSEASLHHAQLLNLFWSGDGRVVQHKAQTGNTVADGGDVTAPAHQFDQFIDVLLVYFAHDEASKTEGRDAVFTLRAS